MFNKILLSTSIFLALLLSSNASACDDKSCESAYILATQQYSANAARRANTFLRERHAHSSNRERRAYALYVHLHFMRHGDPADK